jgi:hypothetical protein
VADFTGRGATRSRAFVHQDVVVCPARGQCDQAAVNLVAADRGELVRLQRDALQRAIEMQPVAAVERLTGRIVRTFLSGTSALGEVFVLEPAASSPVSPAAD